MSMQKLAETVTQTLSEQKWPPYREYKDSGVEWLGMVPRHWEVKRLRRVCKFNPPKSELSSLPLETQVSFLAMENISEKGELFLAETRRIDQVWQGYTYFRDQDVIIAKITPCFENGKGAWCRNLYNGIGFGTTELHVLRPKNVLLSAFLAYITGSQPFRILGEASMYGAAGQQRVSDDFIKDFQISIPPLSEQRAIITFLDHHTARIDALIAKKEQHIALLQEKRAALISQAVTQGLNPDVPMKDSGVEWLGMVPEHWDVRRLAMAVKKITNGYVGPTRDILVNEGIRYLQSLHIKNGTIKFDKPYYVAEKWSNEHAKSILKKSDVVIVQTGDVGQCCAIPEEFEGCNCHALIIVQLKDGFGSGFYLSAFLRSHYGKNVLQQAQTGALHPHLECGKVREIQILLPPPEEQGQILVFIDHETQKIDALISTITEGIKKLQEYRTALISAAVTGKIDVRGMAVEEVGAVEGAAH